MLNGANPFKVNSHRHTSPQRLTSSMPTHPLPILLNNSISVALCSDDPAMFGNMGLSYDFFQVLVASDVTGLLTLKGLAKKSLEG